MRILFLFIYNVLFALFLIVLIPFALIFSSNFRRNFFYRTSERIASWRFKPDLSKDRLWFHCSSIGEVRAAEPLLCALKDSNTQIILTVVTKTAREYAKDLKFLDFTALFPLDLYPFTARAFKIIKPTVFLPIETELWPSLLYAASAKKIKIISVNGRISQKTFNSYKAFSFFWSPFIKLIDIVLARSFDDAKRYEILSKGSVKTFVTGNIKYDRDFSCQSSRDLFYIKDEDIVFTAGSIREGEDKHIIEAYKILSRQMPNIKFFIAPRHIDKIGEIEALLTKEKIAYTIFSKMQKDLALENNIVLIDIFGKLQEVYSISDICFIGGSFIDKGGQNPIEAAAYGKAVLFGQYMDNFKTEAKLLIDNGGAMIVKNAQDLAEQSIILLSDRQKLKEMGQKALQTVQSQKGSVQLTIEKIKEFK